MSSSQRDVLTSRPLSFMNKVTQFVYIYEPTREDAQQEGSHGDPKLILVGSWMDAQDAHIAKYLAHYQQRYPTSKVLLVKFFMKEAFSASLADKAVQPAVTYLRSLLDSGFLSAAPSRPEVMVHLFSNGGMTTLRNIYLNFRQQTKQPFPLHCAIYDSCPGYPSFVTGYNAFILSFKKGIMRMLAAPCVVLLLAANWIWYNPLKFLSLRVTGEHFLVKNARLHNDRDLVRQTNRTYIYGNADPMVDWRHIAHHSKQAAARGFAVRDEVFDNSPHVAHMRTNSSRYWEVVAETWNKVSRP
ncbi:hypothetical protein F4780DRAFT_744880 [Xylariomycetidae sp. FL0641]|nr:hypothetical protein F4780DRAFT_744880 [Xylariomycetidae sp. FL0641]